MTARSRKRKAELLEELTQQDKLLAARDKAFAELESELREAEDLVTNRLIELEEDLAWVIDRQIVLEESAPNSEAENTELPLPVLYPHRPKRTIWLAEHARVLAVTALALVFIGIVLCFALSGSFGAATQQTAADSKYNPAKLKQNGASIGSGDKELVIYGNLYSAEMREAYKYVLAPMLDKNLSQQSIQLVFHPLADFSNSDSINVARAAVAASAENRLWNFIEVYLQDQGSGKQKLDQAIKKTHLKDWRLHSEKKDHFLQNNVETAADKILDDNGVYVVIVGNRRTPFSLDTALPEISKELRRK